MVTGRKLRVCAAIALVAVSAAAAASGAGGQQPSSRQLRVERYVGTALAAGLNTSACARLPIHLPAKHVGSPPRAFLSILGVLRGPAEHVNAASDDSVTTVFSDVYVNSVHLARSAAGYDWYVFLAGPERSNVPPLHVKRCVAAEIAALRRELPRIPRALRRATTSRFDAYIHAQRRSDAAERRFYAHPLRVGVDLFGSPSESSGPVTSTVQQQARHGVVTGAAEMRRRGLFVAEGASFSHSIVAGVVPDGVATVTLHYAATHTLAAATVTAPAADNLVVARVSRGFRQVLDARVVWRSHDGTILRRFSGL